MQRLTSRQQAIYDFIVGQIQIQGLPPTLVEIAEAFGLRSAAGISDHLRAIERKGYIRRRRGVSRGIELSNGGRPGRRASVRLPLMGDVPAASGLQRGTPDRCLYVDARTVGPRAFGIRCRRDLPASAVLSGDTLLVDPDVEAAAGALVLGRQGARTVLLQLANRNQASAVAGQLDLCRDLEILGAVTGIVRSMIEIEP